MLFLPDKKIYFYQKKQTKSTLIISCKLACMTEREKIIRNYIDGYNQFDVNKMVTDFAEKIVFENIQNGEVNMTLNGMTEFIQQAEQGKAYFSKRTQTIKSFNHTGTTTEIEIEYNATLAMDFANGIKKGQQLNLTGKSIFEFEGNRIIKLVDVS
jgi:Putative lumazine-binding